MMNKSTYCCNSDGVTCDRSTGEVISIDVSCGKLQVGAMKQLEELDLSSNEIQGQILHWAGEIGGNELYRLNLSHNFITGSSSTGGWVFDDDVPLRCPWGYQVALV